MAKDGVYAKLHRLQFAKEREAEIEAQITPAPPPPAPLSS
jgi:hypothetical protein